jgi:ring-1,2-phenylacetyl-CoA epoxidase subunit PaaE
MSKFHKLTVTDIRNETSDCVSIAFDVPDELKTVFAYKPGQNITVRTTMDGEEIRRSYSICSSPAEGELRIAVKKVADGRFSSFANSSLHPGDPLEIMEPSGRFHPHEDQAANRHYLMIAAGSGITPIVSIIKHVLSSEPSNQVTLIFGNRNKSSIIFREQLEGLKNRYINRFVVHHVLSRENTEAQIYSGRISGTKLAEFAHTLIPLRTVDEVFICGPEEMIFSVRDWLYENDFPRERIHFELFTVPGSPGSSVKKAQDRPASFPGKQSKVSVKIDGLTTPFELLFDGPAILDAALQHGADLPFACKGGVCATCRARLVEGEVEMDTNYALEPDELRHGFILTCQSHPRSEVVVVDFDLK